MIDLIRGTRNLAGATLIALAVSAPAMAAPVLWTVSDVTFNDGGTASGSFVYDADLNTYSSVDITTTAGALRSGARFTQLLPGAARSSEEVLLLEEGAGGDLTGASYFYLYFFPLTNVGGIGQLLLVHEGSCADAACSTEDIDSLRYTESTAGALVAENAVPEPASIAILGAALLGIGALGNRRRHPLTHRQEAPTASRRTNLSIRSAT